MSLHFNKPTETKWLSFYVSLLVHSTTLTFVFHGHLPNSKQMRKTTWQNNCWHYLTKHIYRMCLFVTLNFIENTLSYCKKKVSILPLK